MESPTPQLGPMRIAKTGRDWSLLRRIEWTDWIGCGSKTCPNLSIELGRRPIMPSTRVCQKPQEVLASSPRDLAWPLGHLMGD